MRDYYLFILSAADAVGGGGGEVGTVAESQRHSADETENNGVVEEGIPDNIVADAGKTSQVANEDAEDNESDADAGTEETEESTESGAAGNSEESVNDEESEILDESPQIATHETAEGEVTSAAEDVTGEPANTVFSGDQTIMPFDGEEAEINSFTVTDTEPSSHTADLHNIAYLSIGIIIGVIICLIELLIVGKFRKKGKRATQNDISLVESQGETELNITVDKLHEIGCRDYQQDCFSVTPIEAYRSLGILLTVADGMGGLENSDQVSEKAVKTVTDGFFETDGSPNIILLKLLAKANSAVNTLLGRKIGRSGTTMVMGLIKDGMLSTLSVGDSRICLFRDGDLIQLNRDHIKLYDQSAVIANGEAEAQAAYSDRDNRKLTSYIGMGKLRLIDIAPKPIRLRQKDKIVLMTDGVFNALNEDELKTALSVDPGNIADALRSAIQSKCYPDQDNYTAVVLTC